MPDSVPHKQLVFGPVVIEWDAKYRFPVVPYYEKDNWFITQCAVTYRYGDGDYPLVIEDGFQFDGASIPWWIRWAPGFKKIDWHLLAALPHDYCLERPSKWPRSVADGIFVSVLIALAEYRMGSAKEMTMKRRWITKFQGYWMFMAVWSWTIATRIMHPPNNVSKPPDIIAIPEVGLTPTAEQAEAVEEAQKSTKEETATPPDVKNMVN